MGNRTLSVHSLQRMAERRPVVFFEDIVANLHDVVRANTQDVGVERSMVDRAHRDPIRHDGLASVAVFLDMGRIEEFRVSQPAEGARAAVRSEERGVEKLADAGVA